MSRLFPDMQFVVFHGAWDADRREGPYAPSARVGIDTLLAALDRHQVPPNDNVWADLGTVWRQLMTRPDRSRARDRQAAEPRRDRPCAVGNRRGLVRVAATADRGRSVRSRSVPRRRSGTAIPALTDELKRKVFGLNAATLFGIDPDGDAMRARIGSTHDVAGRCRRLARGRRARFAVAAPAARCRVARCSNGWRRPPRAGARTELRVAVAP